MKNACQKSRKENYMCRTHRLEEMSKDHAVIFEVEIERVEIFAFYLRGRKKN